MDTEYLLPFKGLKFFVELLRLLPRLTLACLHRELLPQNHYENALEIIGGCGPYWTFIYPCLLANT